MRPADGGIFISYRRRETGHLAGRLADRLTDRFGADRVFMDVDTIEPGVDFAEEIFRAVGSCAVLVAVIGRTWLSVVDKRGRRRLDDPDDIVRLEIEAALERDTRVIPILVDGAVMPGRDELPGSLAGLARRNALTVAHESFRSDVGRLVGAIERVLAAPPAATPAADPPARATSLPTEAGRLGRAWDSAILRRQAISPFTAPDRRARAIALLTEAERLARTLDGSGKPVTLGNVAAVWAPVDAARASALFAEAERLTRAEMYAVGPVAAALAASDPEHAVRLARSAPGMLAGPALDEVAQELAATDPGRAQAIGALPTVVAIRAATDPSGAERLARTAPSDADRAAALARLALTVAPSAPAHAGRLLHEAEQIVRAGPPAFLDHQLGKLARVATYVDRDRAERLAGSLTLDWQRDWVHGEIAAALAATDPDGAERRAGSLEVLGRNTALRAVAAAVAAADPDRAERVARTITDDGVRASALCDVATVLLGRPLRPRRLN